MEKKKYIILCLIMVIMLFLFLPNKSNANTAYYETSKYKIIQGDENLLVNLDPKNLTVKTILENINTVMSGYNISVYNIKGEKLEENQKVGTGSYLSLVDDKGISINKLPIIVYGDTNGDGNINSSDALAIIKNKIGKIKFENEYFLEAGRISDSTRNKSSIPNSADALTIIKYKLGKADINQYYKIKTTEPEIKVENDFFYNQLDSYGRTIYNKLYSDLDNLKTGTYTVDFGETFNDLLNKSDGKTILMNAFQLSLNALILDHPDIFYLDIEKMSIFISWITTSSETIYKVSVGPDKNENYLISGFNSSQDVYNAEKQIKEQLDKIISNLSGNTYDKILQVHNYLIDNITYNESDMSHNLYGALINKVAVCEGYAEAFKYILDNIGISCVEICGDAQNSSGDIESHAWNDVLLNGKWYAIDVTWDDPIIIGGTGILTNELRYSYFLKGSDTFYKSHQEDGYVVENGEFKYPQISTVSYY